MKQLGRAKCCLKWGIVILSSSCFPPARPKELLREERGWLIDVSHMWSGLGSNTLFSQNTNYNYTIFNQIQIQIRSYFCINQICCPKGIKYKYVFDPRLACDDTWNVLNIFSNLGLCVELEHRSKAQNVGIFLGYLNSILNFRWHIQTFLVVALAKTKGPTHMVKSGLLLRTIYNPNSHPHGFHDIKDVVRNWKLKFKKIPKIITFVDDVTFIFDYWPCKVNQLGALSLPIYNFHSWCKRPGHDQ